MTGPTPEQELRPTYEIRDPIHGLVRLTDTEVAVVNSGVFQRLRRIRQLAMADLVYPGALHTRFEHSLGTFHLACRILDRLSEIERLSYNDRVAVRLAALLHDVGHGPFSHVSEYLLDQLYSQATVGAAASREKIHEKITVDLIQKDAELRTILTEDQRRGVAEVIEGAGRRKDFRHDIISSSLDADKMDYLLRDAYYAGVQYGRYDLEKVIASFVLYQSGRESFLMVSEDGIFAVEQLVHSKHHMTQQVYAHRVRTITDVMIVRGLELAVETDDSLRAAYTYDGSEEQLVRYVMLDDGTVTNRVLGGEDARAKDIFERLRARRLYKQVCLIPIDEHRLEDAVLRWKLGNMEAADWKVIEAAVAEKLGCEPWEVIAHRKSVKNPAFQTRGSMDPEAIQVLGHNGTPRMLSEFDELAIGTRPSTERLHIIAPWDGGASLDRESRRKAREHLDGELRNLVLDSVRELS